MSDNEKGRGNMNVNINVGHVCKRNGEKLFFYFSNILILGDIEIKRLFHLKAYL